MISPIVPSFDFNVGYEFVGWNYVNYDEAVYEDPAYRTVYVMPIYESKPASACIGSMYFSSINDALLMASSNDVVTVIKNADANYIIQNAIINEGVTLYIPYGSGVGLDLANGTIQNGTLSEDNRYMSVTLTGDLDVYGSLVIGGVTGYVSQYYGDTLQGTVCGAYSEILMCDASSIAVGKKDGSKTGKIDCYGFIRDYSTESNPAKIYVYKNSEVNQPFVIHDWIDVDFGYDSYRNDYSVFNRYSMPCIETETSYYYGGNLNGIGKVYEGGFTTILVRIINTKRFC